MQVYKLELTIVSNVMSQQYKDAALIYISLYSSLGQE